MSIGSGVFDPLGSKNGGVPLTRHVALTAVLHYRADCDQTFVIWCDTNFDVSCSLRAVIWWFVGAQGEL